MYTISPKVNRPLIKETAITDFFAYVVPHTLTQDTLLKVQFKYVMQILWIYNEHIPVHQCLYVLPDIVTNNTPAYVALLTDIMNVSWNCIPIDVYFFA